MAMSIQCIKCKGSKFFETAAYIRCKECGEEYDKDY